MNREKKNKWMREYYNRPEVKARAKKYRQKYNQIPENKRKKKEYNQKYNQNPENKRKKKEYMREYVREYYKRPEVKEKRRELRLLFPEIKRKVLQDCIDNPGKYLVDDIDVEEENVLDFNNKI